MREPTKHSFKDQLSYSATVHHMEVIVPFLRSHIPGAIVIQFVAHVSAIVQGIDKGEPIVLPPDAMKRLAINYKLLLDRLGKE